MAELTDAANVAADVAESVAEEATNVAEVSRAVTPQTSRGVLIGLGLGLIGGAVIGGLYMNRRLSKKYEELVEEEVSEMREHFRARLTAREEKPTLDEVEEIVEREGYDGPAKPVIEEVKDEVVPEVEAVEETVEEEEVEEVVPSEEVRNVFDDTDKDPDVEWDYEAEVALRRPDYPYIIHVDEQHEKGYIESDLIYYEGDDVLCAENDSVLEDKEKVVGVENLGKFGHGSEDKDTLYIRNDVLGIEVKVVRNDGSYAEVVHGFQHSDEVSNRRRRQFDDGSDAA